MVVDQERVRGVGNAIWAVNRGERTGLWFHATPPQLVSGCNRLWWEDAERGHVLPPRSQVEPGKGPGHMGRHQGVSGVAPPDPYRCSATSMRASRRNRTRCLLLTRQVLIHMSLTGARSRAVHC